MADRLKEETIVNVAYEMATKMANIKYTQLKSLSIDREDFIQDAVMYILDKYRDNYMNIDNEEESHGMIFKMLGRFTLNKFQITAKRKSREMLTLDQNIDDSEDNTRVSQLADEERLNAEELVIDSENLEEGEALVYQILDRLNVTPFKTTKYQYTGQHPILGDDLKLSEYNIGRLLFINSDVHDILKTYGVDVQNIGADSEASYVYHKIKAIIKKIEKMAIAMTDEEKASIAKFLEEKYKF